MSGVEVRPACSAPVAIAVVLVVLPLAVDLALLHAFVLNAAVESANVLDVAYGMVELALLRISMLRGAVD